MQVKADTVGPNWQHSYVYISIVWERVKMSFHFKMSASKSQLRWSW